MIVWENFTKRQMEVNFPSADWFSYLRTQLTVFVSRVCLQRKNICSALYSQGNFLPEGDTLKSDKAKGICSIALKFGQKLV